MFTILVAMFSVRADSFADLNARADFSYTKTKSKVDGVESDSSTFNENYTLGFRKTLTRTIAFAGDVRLSRATKDGDKDQSLYPVITLYYTPPEMYNLRFGYNRTETSPSDGDRITTSNTNVSFSLPYTKYPSLNLTYNRSTSEDHNTPQQLNDVLTNITLNTGYTFELFETSATLNYSYGLYTLEDKVTEITTETPSHIGTAFFSRKFLDGRLTSSANAGYELRETTSESRGGATRFKQEITPSSGLVDDGTSLPILDDAPGLIDNDVNTAFDPPGTKTSIDLSDANWHMGFGFNTSQLIHAIYLYVNVNTTLVDESTIGSYDFGWQLYTSTDNSTWTLVGTVTPTYNSVYNRFEFSFSEKNARYFKVVNTLGPPPTGGIKVTEIEPIGYALATAMESYTTTATRDFWGFNLSYAPTDRLTLGFSFSYDRNTRESKDAPDVETVNMRHGSNLSYIFIPKYLTVSTSYSSLTIEEKGGTDTGSEFYSLTFSSAPLETLNSSLTYSHTESTSGGAATSVDDTVGMNVFMNLYTGIDLNFSASMAETDSPQQNSKSSSRSYMWNLRLVPWKPLVVLVNAGTSGSETDQAGTKTSSSTKTLSLDFSYTPTRKVYFSGNIDLEPDQSQSYSVTWLPTRTLQMGLRLNQSNDTKGGGADFSWQPFKPLSLHLGYNVTVQDNDTNDRTEIMFARASIVF